MSFSYKEKLKYLEGEEKYTLRAKKENELIGKIVCIDWDLQSECFDREAKDSSEYGERIEKWIQMNDKFVITDVSLWGVGSKVTLDCRFNISIYRLYDPKTNRYIFTFEDINGVGKGKYSYTQRGT